MLRYIMSANHTLSLFLSRSPQRHPHIPSQTIDNNLHLHLSSPSSSNQIGINLGCVWLQMAHFGTGHLDPFYSHFANCQNRELTKWPFEATKWPFEVATKRTLNLLELGRYLAIYRGDTGILASPRLSDCTRSTYALTQLFPDSFIFVINATDRVMAHSHQVC